MRSGADSGMIDLERRRPSRGGMERPDRLRGAMIECDSAEREAGDVFRERINVVRLFEVAGRDEQGDEFSGGTIVKALTDDAEREFLQPGEFDCFGRKFTEDAEEDLVLRTDEVIDHDFCGGSRFDRLAHQQPHFPSESLFAEHAMEDGENEAAEFFIGRGLVIPKRRRDLLNESRVGEIDGFEVEGFLTAEVIIESGVIDPCPVANLTDGGLGEAPLGEDRSGGEEDSLSSFVSHWSLTVREFGQRVKARD